MAQSRHMTNNALHIAGIFWLMPLADALVTIVS
jgi:hypothetical protein